MTDDNAPKMGELRRTQVVSTHGPGAVVDYLAERGGAVSGITLGLDRWHKAECRRVIDPALQRLLGVHSLFEPPVSIKSRDNDRIPALPAARFPKWLECPECHTLRTEENWRRKNFGSAVRLCSYCTQKTRKDVAVLPARFMIICDAGHLSDFPWMEWVEHAEECPKRGRMQLDSKGAGLRNLFVRCVDCGRRKSMRDAIGNISSVLKQCPGARPWLGDTDPVLCERKVHTALRGSANLYFPAVASALTIPPWTDQFREGLAAGGYWDDLMNARDDLKEDDDTEHYERCLVNTARRLARNLAPNAPDEIAARQQLNTALKAYDSLPASDGGELARSQHELREEEWRQFRSGTATRERTFEMRPEPVPTAYASWFEAFVRIPRLREVRALRGFTRRFPPNGTDEPPIAPLACNANWLPVIETLGEGIFIALNEATLVRWETEAPVYNRAEKLHRHWIKDWQDRYKRQDEPPNSITPRLLLVHSLSHALMTELSVTCGYSATSLQERLYVSEPGATQAMAGVLIYTASADADGTLGGLEREGLSARLAASLKRAVCQMRWCSSDPLCSRGISTTSDMMNGAACHSCLFISETSCELFNRSLDRTMMFGNENLPGYFSGFTSV